MRNSSKMKILIWIFTMILTLGSFIGCGYNEATLKDSEIYKVELFYEKTIPYGSSFVIRVKSKNIAGKDLHKKTCSTLYKLGATIEIYTIIDDKKFVLQDEFETLTDDIIVETIKKMRFFFMSGHLTALLMQYNMELCL